MDVALLDHLASLAAQFGFPGIVALWLLWRLEGHMRTEERRLTQIEALLERIDRKE